MPRIADEPLEKISVNIFATDAEWLRAKFGQDRTAIGYGDVIRMLIRKFRRKCEAEDDAHEEDLRHE
jgi:hypothetical protein